MKIDLSGKTALVTGSTKGIGFAAAKGLREAGAEVIINGRTEANVEEAVHRIASTRVRGIAADLGTAAGCESLVASVDRVDILVNNLGVYEVRPAFEIGDAEWSRMLEVNLMSGVRLSRAFGPSMVTAGWGRILFVSSESALHVPASMVHYGTTKLAQLALARGLAEAVAETGVTVNSVLPGPTLSEGVEDSLQAAARERGLSIEEMGERFVKRRYATSLLGRMAEPEEVANLIVYLSSPQASATTGAALRVDGGIVRAVT